MPAHSTVHVYSLLLDRIGRGNGASLNDLRIHLEEHDFPKSERSISRYIEELRNEFGLDIVYDYAKRSYCVNKQSDFEVENFLNLLTLSQMASIDIGNPKKWREIQHVLQFDQIQQPKGLEHINEVTSAILKRKFIQFDHFNFYTQKVTVYTIKPLLLKQYQYRWYVIGEITSGELRTFGLDRLQKLMVLSKTFPVISNKAIRQKFDQVIGLDFSNEIPLKIKIASTPFQANYLKSVPLHQSQNIESEKKKEVIFTYQLIPNLELIQKILMMADQVRVLEPLSLKNHIKHLLNKTLKKYR